jgi:PAS domain S-box-containing protein
MSISPTSRDCNKLRLRIDAFSERVIGDQDFTLRTLGIVCLGVTLSYLSAKVGLALVVPPHNISLFWFTNALLFAVLLLVPRRVWPMLIVTAYAGVSVLNLQSGNTIISTGWFALANMGELLFAAFAVSYVFKGVPRLNSPKTLAQYGMFVVILPSFVSAFIGALAGGEGDYWLKWRIWFVTDCLALLILPSAVWGLVRLRSAWRETSRAYYVEFVTLIALLGVVGYGIFVTSASSNSPALLYSLVPFLLWSALRFGSTGVTASVVVVTFLAIWGAVHGRGPFTEPAPINDVLLLQLFVLISTSAFMVLAAVVEEQNEAVGAVRESEQRFDLVANMAPVLIWMSGLDKRCMYFNQPWLDFTGRGLQAELGNGWAEGVHSEDFERCLKTYVEAFDRRNTFKMEYRLRRHDGEYRWMLDTGVPRFTADGSFAGYIGSCIDVTDRHVAQETVHASETKFRALFESNLLPIIYWNEAGTIVDSNEAFLQLTGFTNEEVKAGKLQADPLISEDRSASKKAREDWNVTQKRLMQFEKQFVLRDGRHIPVLVTASLSGKRHSGMAFLMDLTERKRTEQTLRDLSARLIHGQEEERTRIARELHDDIGQRMALISIELEQLSQLTKESSQEQQSLILKLSQQAREITTDVQHISHELHSPKLEHLGLVSAVKALCRDFSQHRKMRIEVIAQADFAFIPSDVAVCLYRVIQEALQNAVKHSHSPEAKVDLHAYPDHIDIVICDSGIGFDPDSPMARAGLGLVSMRERLRFVQGTLPLEP